MSFTVSCVIGCSYLYDLSREIQDLVRVLKSREDSQSARIRELEVVLKDWFDVFGNPPAELKAAGIARESGTNAPSAVAHRLKELFETCTKLRTGVDTGRSRAEKELADMRLALRDSGRVSREQAAAEIMKIRADADAAIASERAAKQKAEQSLSDACQAFELDKQHAIDEALQQQAARHEVALQKCKSHADDALRSAHTQRDEARKRLHSTADILEKERAISADASSKSSTSLDECHGRIQQLEAQLVESTQAATSTLRDTVSMWQAKYDREEERHRRDVATTRVRALESEIAFLTSRVHELQQMVEVMQKALFNGAATLNAAAGVASLPGKEVHAQLNSAQSISPYYANIAGPIGAHWGTAGVRHHGATTAAAVSRTISAAHRVAPITTETKYLVVRAVA
jgi:hypothetical protein